MARSSKSKKAVKGQTGRPKNPAINQKDTNYPRCLGWCGGKRFKPKFRFDRYCMDCTRKKLDIENGMSMRAHQEQSTGNRLGDDHHSDI